MNLMLNALVIIATVLGSGMALPQARQLARTRQRRRRVAHLGRGQPCPQRLVDRVRHSPHTCGPCCPVSIISFALYGFMAIVFVATHRSVEPARPWLSACSGSGWCRCRSSSWAAGNSPVVVVGLCYGLQLLPAVVAVLRTRQLGGVSPATWLIAWVESSHLARLRLGPRRRRARRRGLLGVAMASVILVRLVVTGHQPMAIVHPSRDRSRGGGRRNRHYRDVCNVSQWWLRY